MCTKSERHRSEGALTRVLWLTKPQVAVVRPAERLGDDAMKKFFLILIASLALVMAHDFNGVYAGDHDSDGGHGIPLSKLAGKYATAYQGSVTVCFKPDFSAAENCSTAGAKTLVFNNVLVGQDTQDRDGDACGTATFTQAVPGSPLPPLVVIVQGVTKVTNYDPATGSGDSSFTFYAGGKCIGSKFDSRGATVTSTGTAHFAASDNGERLDAVITTTTDSVGDIGAFNIGGFDLKQKE